MAETWYFEFLQSFLAADGRNNFDCEGRHCICLAESDLDDITDAEPSTNTARSGC